MAQLTSLGSINPENLPDGLRQELAQLDRRLRWVSFARGVGALLVVCLGMAAIFLAIDFLYPLSGVIRFGFLSLFGATLLWATFQWILIPLSRRHRWPDLAYLIDRSHPDLQERVSSTVELALSPHQSSIESEFMRSRLEEETNDKLMTVDLWDCLSLQAMGAAVCSAVVLIVLSSVPFLFNTQAYSLLWQRFLTPWVNLDSATNLTFIVEDGDRVIPRGDDVLIRAEPHWRYSEGELPREINLTWTDSHGNSKSRDMSFDAGRNAYVGKIPEVMSATTFVLSSSHSRSRMYEIRVADRPRIVDVQLEIIPPAYTQLETEVIQGAIGTIRVVEGSRMRATLQFENPVMSAAWAWSSLRLTDEDDKSSTTEAGASSAPTVHASIISGVIGPDQKTAVIETVATQTDKFEFIVKNVEELTNIDEPNRLIQIVPDRAPRIDLAGDRDPVKVNSSDVIPVHLTADDDFGLMDVQVVVEHLSQGATSKSLGDWNSEKTGIDVLQIQDQYELNLASLDLKPGDIIGYRAVARDGRPVPGPNETWTTRRVLLVDDEVKTLAGQMVEEFYASVRRHADIVKNEIAAHRRDLEKQRRELDPQPREKADETVEERSPEWQQTKLALSLQLEDLARRLDTRPITKALARMQVEPAQDLIEQTAKQLEEHKSENENDSIELVRNQEQQVREAEKSIERLLNQLRDAERIEQELTELQQLARRARDLSNEAQKLNQEQSDPQAGEPQDAQPSETPDDVAEQRPIDELQNEWSALKQDLDRLLQRRPELKQAAKNAMLTDISDAAELAESLASQQEKLSDSIEAARDDAAQDMEPIAQSLEETAKLAEELAAQVAKDSEETANPAFDSAPTERAASEQQQSNLQAASDWLEAAKEGLKRLEQQSEEFTPLSTDPQEAAAQLAERLRDLEEDLKSTQEQISQTNKSAQELKKQQDKIDRKKGPLTEEERAQQQDIDSEKEKLEAQQAEQDAESQKLAERLAGLIEATEALPTPQTQHSHKRNALDKLDHASSELAAQTDRADDRVREAADEMERLSKNLGKPEERNKRARERLDSLAKQAESLANLMKEKSEKGEAADDGVKQNQENQLREVVGSDAPQAESELADAVKKGLEAREQLAKGDLKAATEKQQEFAQALKELTEQLNDQAGEQGENKPDPEGDQPADPENQVAEQNSDNANAEGEASENQASRLRPEDLPSDLREARFPQTGMTNEQLKERLQQLAQAQRELAKKTQEAVENNAAPEKARDLENQLKQLANQQRDITEQTKNLSGAEAPLQRMNAQKSQQQAKEALEEGETTEAMQAQQDAIERLDDALAQVEKAAAEDQQGEGTPSEDASSQKSTEQLAAELANRLKELEESIAAAKPVVNQNPSEANSEMIDVAEGDQPPAEQSLEDKLKGIQATQEKIAAQAQQIAEQAELLDPSKKDRNEQLQAAAQQASQASEQLQSGNLSEGRKQAEEAAESLDQGQEQNPNDPIGDPTDLLADQLAHEQEELVEQLKELEADENASALARTLSQGELEDMTKALAEAFQRFAEQSNVNPISDRQGSEQLARMEKQSRSAAGEMQESRESGQQGNLQQSAEASNQAASQLQQLAQESSQLANTKRDTLVPEPVGAEAAEAARMLQQAQESLEEAMKQQSQNGESSSQSSNNQSGDQPSDPSQSEGQNGKQNPNASALEQLAKQLADAAQALDQAHQQMQSSQGSNSESAASEQSQESNPGKPSNDSDSQYGNQSMLTGDEEVNEDITRSALMRDWGQRKGALEAELSESKQRVIDHRLQHLIRSYLNSLDGSTDNSANSNSEAKE